MNNNELHTLCLPHRHTIAGPPGRPRPRSHSALTCWNTSNSKPPRRIAASPTGCAALSSANCDPTLIPASPSLKRQLFTLRPNAENAVNLDLPAQQLIAEAIRAYLAKHEHTAPHSRPATVHHPHATSSLKAAEAPATYKPDPKP